MTLVTPDPAIDVLVVVALPDERDAVLEVTAGATTDSWTQGRDGLGFTYHHREFSTLSGRPFRVAVARAQAMGGPAAAALTARLLVELKPRLLGMCGICAGRPGKTRLGDLIVADRLYEAKAGKVIRDAAGAAELFHDITTFNLDPRWKAHIEDNRRHWVVENARKLSSLLQGTTDGSPGDAAAFDLHIGPLATVFNVTEDPDAFTDLVRIQRSVLGLEMEGVALGLVSHLTRVPLLVAKAVQDFAAPPKTDLYRQFACRVSAEFVIDFFRWALDHGDPPEAPTPQRGRGTPAENTLRDAAQALLDAATPGRLELLFQEPPGAALDAIATLNSVRRSARRAVPPDSTEVESAEGSHSLFDLGSKAGRSLVLAAPGSGKTHALWNAARTMLDGGETIPLYLAGSRFRGWDEVLGQLSTLGLDPHSALNDGRVLVCFDGWTEFGAADASAHRNAISDMPRARILATGRHTAQHDDRFVAFHLEALSGDTVRKLLSTAFPTQPLPAGALLELLTLPLALVLHILVGGQASSRGEMIARLHERLCEGYPLGLTRALAAAASRTAIRGDRQGGAFEAELREAALSNQIPEAVQLTRNMGLLGNDLRRPRPIHDLYWSWLVGRGLVESSQLAQALPLLDLRESIELAAESGARPDNRALQGLISRDAELVARLASTPEPDGLSPQLAAMMSSPNDAIRRRGVLAGLRSRDPVAFRSALGSRADLSRRHRWFKLEDALHIGNLWHHRAEIAAWADASESISELLDAIAEFGDERWVQWLQKLATSGRAPAEVAAATALACFQGIPEWVRPLLTRIFEKPWLLRPAARRGTNIELAKWTGANYAELLKDRENSSKFVDVNRILVSCGDDSVFDALLERFWDLADPVRRLLSYAVVDKGEPWISAFQKVAFGGSRPLPDVCKLYEVVSDQIDDATARAWVENGPEVLGWRVLARRHGGRMVPELLAALPNSFSELHTIPPLRAMAELVDPPVEVADEIWSRVKGTISPIAMEDIIRALARVRLKGIPTLIAFQRENVARLPNTSFNRFLIEYYKWERETGLSVRVSDATGTRDFGEWIRLARWPADRDDRLATHYLVDTRLPVSDDVLDNWAAGDDSLRRFVKMSGPLGRYHAGAVAALLKSGDGLRDLLAIFGTSLDLFPQAVLEEVLANARTQEDFFSLLSAVASSNEPANRRFHSALIARYLDEFPLDAHASQRLANVLSVHSSAVLRELLGGGASTAAGLWLIRDVELVSRIRLVDEAGAWLT